jgi:hypothetical protein
MIKGSTYSFLNALRLPVLFSMVILFACSKPKDEPVPVIPPPVPPQSTTPSGVIEYFTINDTLIGYNKSTDCKWLVTGTNSLTVVTLGGNKVTTTGPFPTGRLLRDSLFILAVNSGAQMQQMVRVADPVTTALYNDGKFAMKTKTEIADTNTAKKWKDTVMLVGSKEEKIYFKLNGTSTIFANSTAPASDGGPVVVTVISQTPPPVFIWRMITYTIVSIDNQYMTLSYYLPNIAKELRDTYTFYQ